MVLADSSVWIAALRGLDSAPTRRLRTALGRELVTTDVVVMEVVAGARVDHLRRTERLLAVCERIPTEPHDFDDAAAIYRECRRRGATPRSLLDCLIAAVARRVDAAVLHLDRDFDVLAAHVDLRIDPAV